MTKFVIFENPGVLDIRALTMLGINAKMKENAIGSFGTGLCYAAAVSVRLSVGFAYQNGRADPITHTGEVIKHEGDFRGKAFEFLKLRYYDDVQGDYHYGADLPFTTEFGKNWEMWQVIRELESNCRDENGRSYLSDTVPAPEENVIRFILEGSLAVEAFKKLGEIFFDKKYEGSQITDIPSLGQIVCVPSTVVYYRGIQAFSSEKQWMNTYNLLPQMTLTEDRTIKHTYDMTTNIVSMIMCCKDRDIIRRVLIVDESKPCHENGLNQYYRFDVPEHITFWEVAEELFDNPRIRLNQSVTSLIIKYRAANRPLVEKDLDDLDAVMLSRAISLAGELGLFAQDYKVSIVDALPNDALGQAWPSDKRIAISARNFEMGWQTVAGTLIEEIIHCKFDYHDMTRQMQDWLLRQLTIQTWKNVERRDKTRG